MGLAVVNAVIQKDAPLQNVHSLWLSLPMENVLVLHHFNPTEKEDVNVLLLSLKSRWVPSPRKLFVSVQVNSALMSMADVSVLILISNMTVLQMNVSALLDALSKVIIRQHVNVSPPRPMMK
jgi:uncharacterized membrane protein